jgi:type I restriction enzyme S subunit
MRVEETVMATYRNASDLGAWMLKSLRNALLSQGQDGRTNWPTVTLQDVALGKNGIVDGPFGSNLKTIHFRDHGHPVIASSMFTDGRFEPTLDEYRYVDDAKFEQLIRNRVHGGDIVVVLIGVNCGTSAVLPDDHPPGVITQNCLKISVNPSVCSREYLLAALRWLKETGRLERLVTSTQQRALSLGRLRMQQIPLPPRAEQQRITDTLRELEAANDALRVRESQLRQIRLQHQSQISPAGDAG